MAPVFALVEGSPSMQAPGSGHGAPAGTPEELPSAKVPGTGAEGATLRGAAVAKEGDVGGGAGAVVSEGEERKNVDFRHHVHGGFGWRNHIVSQESHLLLIRSKLGRFRRGHQHKILVGKFHPISRIKKLKVERLG